LSTIHIILVISHFAYSAGRRFTLLVVLLSHYYSNEMRLVTIDVNIRIWINQVKLHRVAWHLSLADYSARCYDGQRSVTLAIQSFGPAQYAANQQGR
jgi:hypothetical protein